MYINGKEITGIYHMGKEITSVLQNSKEQFNEYIDLIRANATMILDARRTNGKRLFKLEPRTLPNGVGNVGYVQNVSDDYVINSSFIVTYTDILSTIDLVEFNITALPGVIPQTFDKNDSVLVYGKEEIPYPERELVDSIGKFYTNASRLAFIVAKGTYSNTEDARINFPSQLMRYQLATPIDTLNESINEPFVDVSKNSNNASLQNFAGTSDSGIVELVNPSTVGNNKFDNTVIPTSSQFATSIVIPTGLEITGTYYQGFPIKLKKNTQYKFSWLVEVLSGTVDSIWRFKYSDGTLSSIAIRNGTLITSSTLEVIEIYIYISGGTSASARYTNMILSEGSTALPYEPFTGKYLPWLKADGIDDYGVIANSVELDPTGLEDFAIGCVFKTNDTLAIEYIYAKTPYSSSAQIALIQINDGRLSVKLEGVNVIVSDAGTLTSSTVHKVFVSRKDSNLIVKIDGVETYNAAELTSLTSSPVISLFGYLYMLNEVETLGGVFKGSIAQFIFAKEHDIAKIETAFNKLAEPYMEV